MLELRSPLFIKVFANLHYEVEDNEDSKGHKNNYYLTKSLVMV